MSFGKVGAELDRFLVMRLRFIPSDPEGGVISHQQMGGNIVLVEAKRFGQSRACFAVEVGVRLTSAISHDRLRQLQVGGYVVGILANCRLKRCDTLRELLLAFLLGATLDYGL